MGIQEMVEMRIGKMQVGRIFLEKEWCILVNSWFSNRV